MGLSGACSGAHGLAILWFIITLDVFAAAYILCEFGVVASDARMLLFIMLATILIINAVWQAAGLALARLENTVLSGTGLAQR